MSYPLGRIRHSILSFVPKQEGLAGVGIWALGYDRRLPDLWDALATSLSSGEPDPDPEPN